MPWFPRFPPGPVKSTPRLGFVYVANGVIQNQWKPATVGAGFELTPNLKPLEPVRSQFNVLPACPTCKPTRSATAPAIIRAPRPSG